MKLGSSTSFSDTGRTKFTVATTTNSVWFFRVSALRKNAPKIGISPINGIFFSDSRYELLIRPPRIKLSPSPSSRVVAALRVLNEG